MDSWLKGDSRNVAVVHCKAGKVIHVYSVYVHVYIHVLVQCVYMYMYIYTCTCTVCV